MPSYNLLKLLKDSIQGLIYIQCEVRNEIFRTFLQNFGNVGKTYIQYMMQANDTEAALHSCSYKNYVLKICSKFTGEHSCGTRKIAPWKIAPRKIAPHPNPSPNPNPNPGKNLLASNLAGGNFLVEV